MAAAHTPRGQEARKTRYKPFNAEKNLSLVPARGGDYFSGIDLAPPAPAGTPLHKLSAIWSDGHQLKSLGSQCTMHNYACFMHEDA